MRIITQVLDPELSSVTYYTDTPTPVFYILAYSHRQTTTLRIRPAEVTLFGREALDFWEQLIAQVKEARVMMMKQAYETADAIQKEADA